MATAAAPTTASPQQLISYDQQPHQLQPQQPLITMTPSGGGWVRGGVDGVVGVSVRSGNGVGGAQQQYISRNGFRRGISGDNNGYNGDSGLVVGGGDASYISGDGGPLLSGVEEDQDGGTFAVGENGPLAGTFGTSPNFSGDDGTIYPTLGPDLHVLAHPPRHPHHRHTLPALSSRRTDGAQWWVGDSGASRHGTESINHLYNIRAPTPEE